MNIFENILRDDIVQVSLHELKYQVNVLIVVSSQSIVQFNNIWMLCLL